MKNRLSDLNNHLFARLERLGDEELTGDTLRDEIERAKATAEISGQLIASGSLALKARLVAATSSHGVLGLPEMLR